VFTLYRMLGSSSEVLSVTPSDRSPLQMACLAALRIGSLLTPLAAVGGSA
jgi:hypothetical protein